MAVSAHLFKSTSWKHYVCFWACCRRFGSVPFKMLRLSLPYAILGPRMPPRPAHSVLFVMMHSRLPSLSLPSDTVCLLRRCQMCLIGAPALCSLPLNSHLFRRKNLHFSKLFGVKNCILLDMQIDWFYYRSQIEMDFLIRYGGVATAVEVKAADHTKSKSMNAIIANYGVTRGIKLSAKNVGVSGPVETLPLYMAMFL